MEVIKQVKLNAHFLPMISTAKPKPKAPILEVSDFPFQTSQGGLTQDQRYQE